MAKCAICHSYIDDIEVMLGQDTCQCGGGIIRADDDAYDWDEY